MNESFDRVHTIYKRKMQETLARNGHFSPFCLNLLMLEH